MPRVRGGSLTDRRAAIGDLVADLAQAFPRQKVAFETVEVYLRELNDLDPERLTPVVRALIRESEFFPTVRAIREAYAEAALALPGEAEALGQVTARAAWLSTREGDPPPLHPAVQEALKLVGGPSAFRHATDPGVVTGQFLRLYRDVRAREVRAVQVGNLLGAAPERPQVGPGTR